MGRNMLLLTIFWSAVFTGQVNVVNYYSLQKSYSNYSENDTVALPKVRKSIQYAKNIKDSKHLLFAYEDAMYYSYDRNDKLKYSDSLIAVAKLLQDNSAVSKAYLSKGIIYYFNFRKFDLALHQYLLAAKFLEKSDDIYLKYKIKYNIGVVKNSLGYYRESLGYFLACSSFFENNLKTQLHPNLQFNNTRGYLNSLHQACISARNLGQWSLADSLISAAEFYKNNKDFKQESGYFLKEKGIMAFHKKQFKNALNFLVAAEHVLKTRNEEAHLSVVYFYLGSSYLKNNRWSMAYKYLAKVDSLYVRNSLLQPEVRKAYELLLKDKNLPHDRKTNIYYMDQLLKADHQFQINLPYLSSRIYREYDTPNLRSEKEALLSSNRKGHYILLLSYIICAMLILFLWRLWWRKRQITENYRQLQLKLKKIPLSIDELNAVPQGVRKMKYHDDVVTDIL